MSVWKINGITLGDLGITDCVLSKKNYAAALLEFTIAKENPLEEPLFVRGTVITLAQDDQPRFIGKTQDCEASGSGGSGAHRYTAVDAWEDLERTVYQQTHCLSDDSFNFSLFFETLLPHVVLGQTPLGGSYQTTTAQMLAALQYAFTKGVQLLPGPLAGGVPFSREEAQSLTVAEVLRRMGTLTPDSAMWIDYSTGPHPTLRFGRRASLDAVSYDIAAADKIISWRVKARRDLVPSGVRFWFISSEVNETESGDGRSYKRATKQEAGLPDGPGGLIAVINRHGGDTSTPAPIPGNMAAEYYLALQSVPYEGFIVTKGRNVLADISVGNVLNLTNGHGDWATMRALVQSVVANLVTGETTVEFGQPSLLPADDFVDQLMFLRSARLDTNLQAVRTCRLNGPDVDDDGNVPDTGGDEADNPAIGQDPAAHTALERWRRALNAALNDASGGGGGGAIPGAVDLQTCEDGQAVTVRVAGMRRST